MTRREPRALPVLLVILLVSVCSGGTTGPGDTGNTGDCPTAAFLNVAAAPGAGAAYADPELQVGCAGGQLVVESNGIPHYTFVARTPNPLVVRAVRVSVPLQPSAAAQPTTLPLLGTIAIAVNGIPIFGPNEAAQPADQAFGDPIFNNITDGCRGHTAFVYHYHALVQKCLVASGLVAEPWNLPDPSAAAASPILGYALDGFAIYGRYECADAACGSVLEMQSSWDRVGDPTTNAWDAYAYTAKAGAQFLDRCNGHVGPRGDYHYHETAGFPYVLGCYTGTPGTATAVAPATAACHALASAPTRSARG